MAHKPHPEPYHVGDHAPEEGEYVCVPCGYRKRFGAGERFTECVSCLKDEGWHAPGTPQDEEDALFDELQIEPSEHHLHDEEGAEVAEGLELWEKVKKPSPDPPPEPSPDNKPEP